MDGIDLSTLVGNLHRVPVHQQAKPVLAIKDLPGRLGPHVIKYCDARFNPGYDLIDHLHHLPLKAFARLSLDELAKIKYSSIFTMDSAVDDKFQKEPQYAVIHKIISSMWRWGCGQRRWNEIVDAYDAIRNFTLPIPGLEIRLDHSTYYNECGYSEYTRTFLDGVFAYLVYYRGEHVMTLGFSISKGRRLLLQQVQLKNRTGNRWLFKLPKNRMEYFIGLFARNFPKHTIYVVDGGDLARKSLNNYEGALRRVEESLERANRSLARSNGVPDSFTEYSLRVGSEEKAEFEQRIAHLSTEIDRIAAFYSDVGEYQFGKSIKMNRLTHNLVIA